MSLAQLVIDSSLQPSWSGLMSNPAKLWLGVISIHFNVVGLFSLFLPLDLEKQGVLTRLQNNPPLPPPLSENQ